jgi:hypothetical protein
VCFVLNVVYVSKCGVHGVPNLPKHEDSDPSGLVVGTTLQLHATID